MDRILQIREKVVACALCDLCRTRIKAVPGRGNPRADVMFIGEAPGSNEDIQGEPFVGAAGRALARALKEADVLEEDVYITNVVKCRPPKNSVPTGAQRESCRPYLDGELDAVNPEIACIMGNTASGSVLGMTGMAGIRGRMFRKEGRLYFVTIHPAATLYRPETYGTLRDDIAKLFSCVRDLKEGRSVAYEECDP